MDDQKLTSKIIDDFFAAFRSSDMAPTDLSKLKTLFIPNAMIIKAFSDTKGVFTVDEFIKPRQKILTDGTLQKFSEEVVSIETKEFGNIAHSFVVYKKSGLHDGNSFTEYGAKSFQFVRLNDQWKISSIAWDDEREGLKLPR